MEMQSEIKKASLNLLAVFYDCYESGISNKQVLVNSDYCVYRVSLIAALNAAKPKQSLSVKQESDQLETVVN